VSPRKIKTTEQQLGSAERKVAAARDDLDAVDQALLKTGDALRRAEEFEARATEAMSKAGVFVGIGLALVLAAILAWAARRAIARG
jgi:hypothetical protein